LLRFSLLSFRMWQLWVYLKLQLPWLQLLESKFIRDNRIITRVNKINTQTKLRLVQLRAVQF
jgi:hypothetical protein